MAGILLAALLLSSSNTPLAAADPLVASPSSRSPSSESSGQPVAQGLKVSHGQIVQRWNFDRHDDRDFDLWPDGWQRRSGRDYPSYVAVEIRSDDTPMEALAKRADAQLLPWWVETRLKLADTPAWLPGLPTRWTRLAQATAGAMPGLPPSLGDLVSSQYLSIRLDGGGALLQSPKFPVSAMYSYVLNTRIQTHGLEHDSGWAEIVFLDAQGRPVKTTPTGRVGGSTSWTQVQTPAIAPPPGSNQAVLRVRVEPTGPGADIRGEVRFDQLQLNQYPQLHVRGAAASGIYTRGETVEITAEAMGLRFKKAAIHFTLLDAHQQPIDDFVSPVDTHQDDSQLLAFGGLATWQLPDLPPGFYRMTAELIAADRSALQTDTTFAVIEPLSGPTGPFGWTLPAGAPRGDLRALPEWLRKCHVGWLKYPCWIDATDLEAGDQLSWMVNRLMESGIQVVGLLNQPPSGTAPEIDARRPVQAVNVFRDQDVWQPLLETLMSRLTMKVQWWQLGNEHDYSFLDRASLGDTIVGIQRGLQGYGQPLNMVLSWPWLEPQPAANERVWKAVTRSETETFTAAELDAYLEIELDPQQPSGDTRTWLLLDPLPKSRYHTDARIRDLVLRMATVRGHAVEAAFVSDPMDPETGLLRPDGLPDIMLLPWRTTAATLGTLQRVGSLRLPNGSSNIVLSDGRRSVMVLWSSQPTQEEIYLGENIEELSVWGVRTAAATVDRQGMTRQVIEAGPVPKFILGLHPLMTRFRMQVELDRSSIDSLLGRSQLVAVKMTNPQAMTLEGDMLMSAGDAWELPRYPVPWQIRGSGTLDQPIPITLRSNAKTGVQTIALQFRLSQVGPQPFLVYRQLRVGPEGLEVQITTRLDEQDNLVVRLEMENSSEDRQSYDCRLFPPGRQYQRQTISVNAGQRVRREFTLPDGRSLMGQTLLLRAAEQDGRRVLNYTVQASP